MSAIMLWLMAQPKYKDIYNQMMQKHASEFAVFKPVHDQFLKNRKKHRHEFDRLGKPLIDTIRFYEEQLCSGMERGNNAVYSAKLAEKFWAEVKKTFPYIELVGVKSSLG